MSNIYQEEDIIYSSGKQQGKKKACSRCSRRTYYFLNPTSGGRNGRDSHPSYDVGRLYGANKD